MTSNLEFLQIQQQHKLDKTTLLKWLIDENPNIPVKIVIAGKTINNFDVNLYLDTRGEHYQTAWCSNDIQCSKFIGIKINPKDVGDAINNQ